MGSLVLPSGKVATMNMNMMQARRGRQKGRECSLALEACAAHAILTHCSDRLHPPVWPHHPRGPAPPKKRTPYSLTAPCPCARQVIDPYSGDAVAEAPPLTGPVQHLVWEFPRMGPQVGRAWSPKARLSWEAVGDLQPSEACAKLWCTPHPVQSPAALLVPAGRLAGRLAGWRQGVTLHGLLSPPADHAGHAAHSASAAGRPRPI